MVSSPCSNTAPGPSKWIQCWSEKPTFCRGSPSWAFISTGRRAAIKDRSATRDARLADFVAPKVATASTRVPAAVVREAMASAFISLSWLSPDKMVSVGPEDLTDPERLVWDAFATGAWVDLRTGDRYRDDPVRQDYWGPDRIVRARVIRALLLGASERKPGTAPAIRLRGARISGRLDLMGTTIDWPLVCEYCQFDNEVRLVESETKTIRITHSRLPGLNGTRIRLDGI